VKRVLLLLCVPFILHPRAAVAQTAGELRGEIVRLARDFLRVPYRWGSASPRRGMDCSGLVRSVYQQVGLQLPRRSAEQYAYTKHVDLQQASPGDLLFFDCRRGRRGIDHVGVYLGAESFVHATRSRGVVVDTLTTPYYRQHLRGIGRHPGLSEAVATP
jgi:peptidoglycan DL-endopeptidase CwlO